MWCMGIYIHVVLIVFTNVSLWMCMGAETTRAAHRTCYWVSAVSTVMCACMMPVARTLWHHCCIACVDMQDVCTVSAFIPTNPCLRRVPKTAPPGYVMRVTAFPKGTFYITKSTAQSPFYWKISSPHELEHVVYPQYSRQHA